MVATKKSSLELFLIVITLGSKGIKGTMEGSSKGTKGTMKGTKGTKGTMGESKGAKGTMGESKGTKGTMEREKKKFTRTFLFLYIVMVKQI